MITITINKDSPSKEVMNGTMYLIALITKNCTFIINSIQSKVNPNSYSIQTGVQRNSYDYAVAPKDQIVSWWIDENILFKRENDQNDTSQIIGPVYQRDIVFLVIEERNLEDFEFIITYSEV
jgi:hypothetical protein